MRSFFQIQFLTIEGPADSLKIEKLSDQSYPMSEQKNMLVLALRDLHRCVQDEAPSETLDPAEGEKQEQEERRARAVIALSLFDKNLEACEVCSMC